MRFTQNNRHYWYYQSLLYFLFFFIFSYLLYSPVLNLWFTYDDSQILNHTIKNDIFKYLFYPDVWQNLSKSSFTPLIDIIFDLNFNFFGMNTYFYYAHNLVVISSCAFFLTRLAENFLPKIFAFLVGITFLLGAPIASTSMQLMSTHYYYGFLFSILCIIYFLDFLKFYHKKSILWSLFFYFVAILSKEMYLIIVFSVLLSITVKSRNKDFKYLSYFLAVSFVFLFWRDLMLGGSIGGPGGFFFKIDISHTLKLIINSINILLFKFTHPEYFFMSTTVFVVVVFLILKRDRKIYFTLSLLPVLLLLYLTKDILSYRHLIVFWAYCSISLGIILSEVWTYSRRARLLSFSLCLIAVIFIFFENRKNFYSSYENSYAISSEGRFFYNSSERDLLLNPHDDFWYYEGLWELSYLSGKSSLGSFIVDYYFLCDNRTHDYTLWRYSYSSRSVRKVSDIEHDTEINEFCRKVVSRELLAKFNYEKPILSWEFGPYESGIYYIVSSDFKMIVKLAKKGFLDTSITNIKSLFFKLKYVSSEGWITYSDDISVDFEQSSFSIDLK